MTGEWKLVPVEPTEDMIVAGAKGRQNSARSSFADGWKLALAASPPAPSGVEPVAWVSLHALAVMKLNGSAGASLRQKRLNAGDAPLYTAEALSAAVAQARREAREEAAAWHDDQSALHDAQGEACGMGSDGWKRHTVAAADHRRSSAAIRALSDAAPAEEGWRPTHQHVKRGSTYRVIGEAEAQVSFDALSGADGPTEGKPPVRLISDGARLTVYQGEDGKLWVRFTDEFNDGRFVAVHAPPAGERDGE